MRRLSRSRRPSTCFGFVGRVMFAIALVAVPAVIAGCSSTRIALNEKLGYAKREQLVDRVKDARDGQEAARKQFSSALEEFLAVTDTAGKNADLEAKYDKLRKEYDRSESRAKDVRSRIDDVQRVAELLFKEWTSELDQYQSASLRGASRKQLDDTRARYDRLLGAMKGAADKMDPVLAAFKDQVLFLKHNLNARAIASIQDTSAQIQGDVRTLISQMEASIAEADAFIRQMTDEPAP